jgi:co-chaperonin GroES (HSP10)
VPLADRVLVRRIEQQAKVRQGRRVPGGRVASPHSSHHSLTSLPLPPPRSLAQSAGGILLPESGKKTNEGEVRLE